LSNPPGSILHFAKYTFLDTNDVRDHFALLLIPEDKSDFINSIYCCVITSHDDLTMGLTKYAVRLISRYRCFPKPSTYVHTHKVDVQEKKGLSRGNPRGILLGNDIKNVFRKLQSYVLSKSQLPPEIQATIIREWRRHYSTQL
jgi:hypothetical protein